MNPPSRNGRADLTWSRFDLPGMATIYGAMNPEGAFIEALSSFTQADVDLQELFDDIAPDQNPIEEDWKISHHMPAGSVPAQWRRDRQLSEFLVEVDGWYVDVLASDTLATLRGSFDSWATDFTLRNPKNFNASTILGPDRDVTCAIASWLSRQILEDGSKLQGVSYLSKHGGDLNCWALWIDLQESDQVEEIQRLTAKRVREESLKEIEENNASYLWAAKSLQLKAH